RAYHGVGFGGISVGGIPFNRRMYNGQLLPNVSHLSSTHSYDQTFIKGQPEGGAAMAEELEKIIYLNDPSTIAAVIAEPMQGSGGVVPSPKGYLEKLREITKKHGILLIFDEVITGFGRLGHLWASERYGIEPDMITFAKGVTSGTVPMGGVMASSDIYNAFMQGGTQDHVAEFPHGYTYTAHPLAIAAANAALDVYLEEDLFNRAKESEDFWADCAMELKGTKNVIDIRTIGLTAGIELSSRPELVGQRGLELLDRAFHEHNLMIRVTGDTIALTPPLIISRQEIEQLFDTLKKLINSVA
ncbi:MAG: aminotransferase class III-fold pyridoxal phosphate-dependent enzyme, partial [Pseudomonadota bacterium]